MICRDYNADDCFVLWFAAHHPPNAHHQLNMSDNTLNTVPFLTGPNYQRWAASMQSYLMSKALWRLLTRASPKLKVESTTTDAAGKETNIYTDDSIATLEKYEEDCDKAVGAMRLRLHENIQYKYDKQASPAGLWLALESDYGNPGVSAAYLEFKGAMNTFLPDNADPNQAMDKLSAHFGRLADAKIFIDNHLKALILMAKIPSSMDHVAQKFAQADDVDRRCR